MWVGGGPNGVRDIKAESRKKAAESDFTDFAASEASN